MARKASQRNKKMKRLNPQAQLFKWLARGVELVLIFSSLFWAVEAVADGKDLHSKSRIPAQHAEIQALKKLAPNFALDSKVPMKVMINPNSSRRVQNHQDGRSGSAIISFKNDPRYAPPIAEVGRFPTPK